MINLGDDKYSVGGDFVVFNKGNAGVATDLKISISKKKAEDHVNAPDYKLTVEDKDGGKVDYPFYYLKDDAQDWQQESLVKSINYLKSKLNAKMPEQFNSYKELIDTAMKAFYEATKDAGYAFAAAAYYGKVNKPNKYLQILNAYSITTNEGAGNLRVPNGALLVRQEPDGQANMKVDENGSSHTMGDDIPEQESGSDLPF